MQSKLETHFVRLYVLGLFVWYITWLVAYPRDLEAVDWLSTLVRCAIIACAGILVWKPHIAKFWMILAPLVTLDSIGSVFSFAVTDGKWTQTFIGSSIRLLLFGFFIVLVCAKGVEFSRTYKQEVTDG